MNLIGAFIPLIRRLLWAILASQSGSIDKEHVHIRGRTRISGETSRMEEASGKERHKLETELGRQLVFMHKLSPF